MDRLRHTCFIAHHSKPVTDEFLKEVMRKCGPSLLPSGKPPTEELYAEELQRLRRDDYRGPLGFVYLNPWAQPENPLARPIEIVTTVRPSPVFVGENGRRILFPLFERDPLWLKIAVWEGYLRHDNPSQMAWFLEKARCVLRMFEPEFGCASEQRDFASKLKGDPREYAWPVLLYGPEMVEKLGRERLLKAPVWAVEELAWGGVWLQVTENPFVATKQDLKKLAEYLRLKVPKGDFAQPPKQSDEPEPLRPKDGDWKLW